MPKRRLLCNTKKGDTVKREVAAVSAFKGWTEYLNAMESAYIQGSEKCQARISKRYPGIFIFCQLVALKMSLFSVINQNPKVISHLRMPQIIDDKINMHLVKI